MRNSFGKRMKNIKNYSKAISHSQEANTSTKSQKYRSEIIMPGQQLRNLSVLLMEDLVNIMKPEDRIIVVGIVKIGKTKHVASTIFTSKRIT
jgi:DNA replicative helicase MCM subunit Mcm2 (Cdc46/Mcm family)